MLQQKLEPASSIAETPRLQFYKESITELTNEDDESSIQYSKYHSSARSVNEPEDHGDATPPTKQYPVMTCLIKEKAQTPSQDPTIESD